ncbi:Hcp family type VI secretion system effector [Microvirga pakistanensis]|uniref:Hcp family type VI secretion system effector n=1 Tax=Microvirga pakistanensis TaxID=1682650 RepID=UPI00106B089D|nr:type VI secretion system tube protein Hcp [Microvirga pakistanensis]
MAVDMFLKIDGVKGEARDKAHKEEIDVIAWAWGLAQSGTGHVGGGSGAGKVSVQDLLVTKYIDKSSSDLMFHCASGKHVKKAELFVRKAGEQPLEYLKITMEDVLISTVSTGGAQQDERLTENVALNFAKVKVEYKEQQADGSGKPAGNFGWDVAANAKY